MSDIRTDNDFLLGSSGASIAPMLPVRITTKQQAYRTAAWLTFMALILPDEPVPSTYDEIHNAIGNT
ncbi:hypothetical protein [Alloactinosynnema sp. L-07]|uniref:hypothetical protein n=1 Tax=Alloactinosynnema sp. L-07 TaxID=1653480 RepID=UPI00065F09B5|nr:hypothetical protein [Alloactinosynnema sp. L-07]CRK59053.1 hypothetical protein [Alloactinosynnema sp. L-07]